MKMGYNNHFWLVKGMEMKCCDRINRNIVVALSLEGLFFKKRYSGNQSVLSTGACLALHQ